MAGTLSSACAPASPATVPVTVLTATAIPSATATLLSTPTSYPSGFIPHLAGRTDAALQLAQPDGFFPAAFRRARAPYLTLYGDGTAYFLSYKEDSLSDRPCAAHLDEPEAQELLGFAVQDARVFSSRDRYSDPTGGEDVFWTTILSFPFP